MKKFFSISLVPAAACLFLAAALPAQKYNFINFNVENGLLQSQATALCQDPARHLWIGTLGGVSRFNGRHFQHFTKTEGLADNHVRTLLCDRHGKIWVGSSEGVSVFDGKDFKTFQVSKKEDENNVTRLVEDRQGQIWALVGGQLFRFKNSGFVQDTSLPEFKKKPAATHPTFSSLDLDLQGSPIAGVVGEGVFFLKNGRWVMQFSLPKTPKPPFVRQVKITAARDTLLATTGGLMVLKNNKLRLLRPDLQRLKMPVNSIEEDANGNVWAGMASGAACILSKYKSQVFETNSPLTHHQSTIPSSRDEFTNHPSLITNHPTVLFFGEKEGFTDNWVSKVFRDAEHRLWFATEVGGIFRFNNFRFTSFDQDAGLADPVVMGIAQSGRTKYVGTGGEGLFKLENGKISPVPLGDNLRHIGSLHADNQGNIYVGIYDGGLWKWSGKGQAKPFTLNNQPFEGYANGIFADEKGAVWVVGKQLLRAAPGSLDLKIKDTIAASDVRRYSPDTLLLTGAQGVWFFDEKRDTATPLPFPELKDAHPICAAVFGEVVCIGTSDRGVFIFQKSDLARPAPPRQPSSVHRQSSPVHRQSSTVHHPPSSVHRQSSTVHRQSSTVHHFDKAKGLPSNFIYNVLAERVAVPVNPPPVPTVETVSPPINQPFNHSTIQPSNVLRVWLGTGYGIACLTLNDDLSLQRITKYGMTDGLTGMESNTDASLADTDGSLWFGLTGGLFHFQNAPSDDRFRDPPAVAPVVHLASVQVLSQPFTDSTRFDGTDVWTGVPHGLRLSHRQNHLTFELDGVCLRNPEQVIYKYKLEGLDERFTMTSNPVVTYSSLPPGRFVFRAFAMTPDSLLSEKPVEYAFVVSAPIHQRLWFQLAVFGALLALAGAILLEKVRSRERQRRRLEQLRAEEFDRLRKRTAEDFHDEMGNKLTRIQVLTDILKLKIRPENPPDSFRDAGQIVEQIKDNVGALYSGSRDIIWSLHPGHDEFWTVVERLREVGGELFSETETRFTFRNEVPEIQPIKISLDFSRNLQMIAKEVFNNALRHAQATQVTLAVVQRDGALALVFSDDGKGFDPAAANGGNGLKNLRNRAERLGVEINIIAEKGKGTNIEVSLKNI